MTIDIRARLQVKQPEISLPENAMDLLAAMPVGEKVSQNHNGERKSSDVETNARLTLIKMVQTKKLEEHYTFKTLRYGGKSFVQSMRTQLGKVRREAKDEGKPLTRFKLLVVAVEQYPTHDLVTVVRSKHASLKTKNLYGELVSLMAETAEPEDDDDGNE